MKTSNSYQLRFSFIHYFRALIQKNWGHLPEALYEIEQSDKLDGRPGEFLTPVAKAEILSYIVGEEQRCRAELNALIERITNLETSLSNESKTLDDNQKRLRRRMFLLLGNSYFVDKDFSAAHKEYAKALALSPQDYYAQASAAQCRQALGDPASASDWGLCLEGIVRSGDFGRKRERVGQALIAILAGYAAKGCGDTARYEQWAREARELLSGNLAVDGLTPRFFSPGTKRLVSSTELLAELEHLPFASPTASST